MACSLDQLSAATILIASLLSRIAFTSADTMSTPTYSSDTLSIFNVSAFDGSLYGGYLDCGAVENCIIYCHNSHDAIYISEATCATVDINASLVTNLAIECIGTFSCYRAEVLSLGPSNQVNLTCDGDRACGRFGLHLINTSYADINCTSTTDLDSIGSPCYSASWSMYNVLSTQIHCGYVGCAYAEITPSSSNTSVGMHTFNVICDDYSSCLGMTIYAAEFYSRFAV